MIQEVLLQGFIVNLFAYHRYDFGVPLLNPRSNGPTWSICTKRAWPKSAVISLFTTYNNMMKIMFPLQAIEKFGQFKTKLNIPIVYLFILFICVFFTDWIFYKYITKISKVLHLHEIFTHLLP